MKIHNTKIKGVLIIELNKKTDDRGNLMRIFDQKILKTAKKNFKPVQAYISETLKIGTFRGIHLQLSPFQEAKLTKCIDGAIYEIVVDLRKESKSYKEFLGIELKAKDNKMLFIPPMVAHGFLTLEDNTRFINFSDCEYNGKFEIGIRHNDPYFNFNWPIKPKLYSVKDNSWPDFKE